MIDIATTVEKYNAKVGKSFVWNILFFFIYFAILVYLNRRIKYNTGKDNVLTAQENKLMYFLFIFIVIYFVLQLFFRLNTWKHRAFMLCVIAVMIGWGVHYDRVAKSGVTVWNEKFILPLVIPFLILPLFAYIAPVRRVTLDGILPNTELFNEMYGKSGGFVSGIAFVMIIYYFVFKMYNKNTPETNALQPLVLFPLFLFSFFYFIAKFLIHNNVVQKYNFSSVMVSLYLLFSVFICYYMYTMIQSLQGLSKESPETARKREAEELAFKQEKGIGKYIRKYVVLVMIASLVILYWIRDTVRWGRLSALGYIFVVVMYAVTAKIVAQKKSGLAGTLNLIYFLELFLATKLRWNSVTHLLNILFGGVEMSNRELMTEPGLIV